MTRVQHVVVSWLATANGGAEKSSVDLCRAIRERYAVRTTLVVWDYNGTFLASDCVRADNATEYQQALNDALSVDPRGTVLISSHRTYEIDVPLAEQHGVRCAVIFRQTPLPNGQFRTISPTSFELRYVGGDDLDWGLLNSAGALVGISDFGARGISRFAGSDANVVRIYNGLTMPGETTPIRSRPIRRFLIVSRLINWKAIDFGLDAFARVVATYPDVRLQIAGDGEEHGRLRRLSDELGIGEHVEFLGFVHDIDRLYAASDCLLHLSGIESFGRVVVEAALCGLPVVVPQSAGTGELVINEHTGLTFDPNDVADCVRAMDRAYHLSAADFDRLAEAGRQRAQAMFSLGRLAEDYVGLANSLVMSADTAS